MSCLSRSIPCKYFAAGGCRSQVGRCSEAVGSEGDWVEKTHVETDGETWERHWLNSDPIRKNPTPAEKRNGFQWAIIVDVEGKENIIELPAIVIDLDTGCEVWRFHRWVSVRKPTGDRNFRSNAVRLQDALRDFFTGLRNLPGFDDRNALMVHCGDFDARMLKEAWEECEEVPLDPLLQKWCNVKNLVFNAVARTSSGDTNEKMHALAESMDGMNKLASFLRVPREDANLEYHHLGMYYTEFIARILLFALEQEDYPIKFQATSDWTGKNGLQKNLMDTNKKVRAKSRKIPEGLQQFLMDSADFKLDDFDDGHLKLLQSLDVDQMGAALAYLLDNAKKHNPRSSGRPIQKWIQGVLLKWIKTHT